MDNARTLRCHRGPFSVVLADPPPTSGALIRSGIAWIPPSEPELALSPSKMWRPASPAHERQRTTTRHVRQQTPVPSLWATRSIPSSWNHCRRKRLSSTQNTPISRVASATSRAYDALRRRRWQRPHANTSGSPSTSGQAIDSHLPPAPRRVQRPRLPPSLFPSPLLRSGAIPQPLPLFSIRPRLYLRVPPPLQPPRRLGALCPHRRHRPPVCRSSPPPRGQLSLRRPRQPPPTPRDDRYLDLRLSKEMFVNKFFPADTRAPIKELASQVDAAFRSLGMDKCHLRFAVQLASQDGTALCEFLVDDILRLRDLLDRAYATPAGAGWVREALDQAAASHRPDRSASSGSDTSSSAGPRGRDEPSSGRGNSKRAILTETSDSDVRQPRYQERHHPDKRKG